MTNWFRVDVPDNVECPKGYGYCYRLYSQGVSVCYPLGLNWVVWIFREIYLRLLATPIGILDRVRDDAFDKGFSAGIAINKLPIPIPMTQEEYYALGKSIADSIDAERKLWEAEHDARND